MTKREIVDTALKGVRMHRVQGESIEPIMPYLLADVMYQIYEKDIAHLPHKHKMKQMDTLWKKRYGLFNRPLFTYFTNDTKDELTDLMDSVAEYLDVEIVMMQQS